MRLSVFRKMRAFDQSEQIIRLPHPFGGMTRMRFKKHIPGSQH
jgi:hypothetical protein